MANSEHEIGCCVGGRCSGLPYGGKRGWDASIEACWYWDPSGVELGLCLLGRAISEVLGKLIITLPSI